MKTASKTSETVAEPKAPRPMALRAKGIINKPSELIIGMKERADRKERERASHQPPSNAKDNANTKDNNTEESKRSKFTTAPDVSFLDKDGRKAFKDMHRNHNKIMDGLEQGIDPSKLEDSFKALAEHTEKAMDSMNDYLDSNKHDKDKVSKANKALERSKHVKDDLEDVPSIGQVIGAVLKFIVNKIGGTVSKGNNTANTLSSKATSSKTASSTATRTGGGFKPPTPKPRGM